MNVVLSQVPNSTNLQSFGYDRDVQLLIVQFKGSDKFYLYHGVPGEVFAQMEQAPSIGKFLSDSIKGKYTFSSFQTKAIETPAKEKPPKAQSVTPADVILGGDPWNIKDTPTEKDMKAETNG